MVDVVKSWVNYFRDKPGDWEITDLLDEDQEFVQHVLLAQKMLTTIQTLDSMEAPLNVRTPRPAIEFVENTLNEWFEIVANIEKDRRGSVPSLMDRSLYEPGDIDWNQGLTLRELHAWNPRDVPIKEMMIEHIGILNLSKGVKKEEPLSGFLNRILPVKFNLRVFAMMIFSSDAWDRENGWMREELAVDGIKLSDLRNNAYQTAAYAKEMMGMFDKLYEFDRGAGVSIGFPSDSPKSAERYVAQFVGSLRNKELNGALFEMGFAGTPSLKLGPLAAFTDEIYLTKQGLYFAMLENPVIDGTKDFTEKHMRFSKKEREFLVTHIERHLPAEWELMLQVAEMIRSGKDRATSMLAELISSRELGRDEASVLRSGVVARMQEMMLVDRIRSGTDIRFELTKFGQKKLVREIPQK